MNTSQSSKQKKRKNRSSDERSTNDIRFLYLNVRNKSYIVRPSSKVYSVRPGTSHQVGPGKYNPRALESTLGFEFSKVPRFDNDKTSLVLNRAGSKCKGLVLNVSDGKIVGKEKKVTVRAKKMKADIIRITKHNIGRQVKEEREEKLKEKFKKVEYRRRIGELAEIKKAWITLFSTFGIGFGIYSFIKNRKKLRARIYAQVAKLRQIILAVGKICVKVKNIRKRKATKRLRLFFLPKINIWIKKRKDFYKSLMMTLFEKSLASSTLFSVSVKWHSLIINMQKTLRFLMSLRKMLYTKLLTLWTHTESIFFQKRCLKKKKHSKTHLKTQNSSRVSSIPEEIKRFFLLKLIKERYSGYLEQAKSYSKSCKAVDELNKIREFEIKVMQHEKIAYPQRPRKVMLMEVIGEDDIKELIQQAERSRPSWNEILNGINASMKNSVEIRRRNRNVV